MSPTAGTVEDEASILARILGGEQGELSEEMARHILGLGLSDRDRSRMHDLAVRNQRDSPSPAEEEEFLAFGKAGDLLAILRSRARRTPGIKPEASDLPKWTHGRGIDPAGLAARGEPLRVWPDAPGA